MTISKGQPWERPGDATEVPQQVCVTDAEVAEAAFNSLERGSKARLVIAQGDLLKTFGQTASGHAERQGLEFDMDLGIATVTDGAAVETRFAFAAHLVIRRRFWSGECLVAMNGGWLSSYYLGPKAHPNDGLLDLTVGAMPLRQRIQAQQRAKLGTHLPHPNLMTKRVKEFKYELETPGQIYVDGVAKGVAKTISVEVISDAFVVLA